MSRLNGLLSGALLAAAFTLGISAQAQAQSARAVEVSHGVFHVQVCPGPAAAGHARCHAHVVTDSHGNPIAFRGPPGGGGGGGTPSGYGPAQLRGAYHIPNNANGTPSGPIIAIVDAYGYSNAESDLSVYRKQFGLPPCTSANLCFTKVDQRGGTSYPRNNTGWSQETALDLDMVSAICPNCRILLVEADSNSFANLATAAAYAASNGAVAVSNSYGGGESGSQAYADAYDNTNGVVTASTGDSGYGVSFPASAPTVTATGGTTLHYTLSTDTRTETAWSGAGSGCSTVYSQPSYQNGVVTDCAMRALADVSAVADPSTGVAVYGPAFRGSAWMVFGGTSVASPLIAGVYGVGGSPALESPYLAAGSGGINDVTSGSNGSCGNSLCNAGDGWDGPTGLGTPNGPF